MRSGDCMYLLTARAVFFSRARWSRPSFENRSRKPMSVVARQSIRAAPGPPCQNAACLVRRARARIIVFGAHESLGVCVGVALAVVAAGVGGVGCHAGAGTLTGEGGAGTLSGAGGRPVGGGGSVVTGAGGVGAATGVAGT